MAVQRKLDADGNVVYEVTDDKNPEAPPVTFNGGKDTRDPSIMELAQQAGVIGTEGRMGPDERTAGGPSQDAISAALGQVTGGLVAPPKAPPTATDAAPAPPPADLAGNVTNWLGLPGASGGGAPTGSAPVPKVEFGSAPISKGQLVADEAARLGKAQAAKQQGMMPTGGSGGEMPVGVIDKTTGETRPLGPQDVVTNPDGSVGLSPNVEPATLPQAQRAGILRDARRMMQGGYSPPTPARDVKLGESVGYKEGPPPEVAKDWLEVENSQAQAVADAKAQEGDALQFMGEEYQKQQEAYQRMLDEEQRKQAIMTARIEKQLFEVDKRQRQLSDLTNETPLDRVWTKKGTFAKIMTILGVSLGAMASAVTGGPNTALDLFKMEVANELDHQQSLQKNTDASMTLLGEMRAIMPPQAALAATQFLLQQHGAATIEHAASLAKSDVERKNGIALAQEIRADAAAAYTKMMADISAEHSVSYKHKEATRGGYSPGLPFDVAITKAGKKRGIQDPKQLAALFSAGSGFGDMKPKDRADFALKTRDAVAVLPDELKGTRWDPTPGRNGVVYAIGSPAQQAKSKDVLANMPILMANTEKIEKLLRETPELTIKNPWSEEAQMVKTLAAQNITIAKLADVQREAAQIGEVDVITGPLYGLAAGKLNVDTKSLAKAMKSSHAMYGRILERKIRTGFTLGAFSGEEGLLDNHIPRGLPMPSFSAAGRLTGPGLISKE